MSRYKKYKQKQHQFYKQCIIIVFMIVALITCAYIVWPRPVIVTAPTQNTKTMQKKSTHSTLKNDQCNHLCKKTAQNVNTILNNHHYIGSVLLVQNQKPVFCQGYGYANRLENKKISANSIFPIASTQKAMTAALILKEVQNGTLQLTDTIQKFYPNIPNAQSITIEQLLTMTSGLSADKTKTYDNVLSDERVIQFYTDTVCYHPYTKWSYSAINYTLLAGILEQTTKKSYQQLITQNFIQPLHLQHTGFLNTWNSNPYRVSLYDKSAIDPYNKQLHFSAIDVNKELGTGNMYASATDLYRIDSAILEGKIFNIQLLQQLKMYSLHHQSPYAGGFYFSEGWRSHGLFHGSEATIWFTENGQNAVVLLSNHYSDDDQKALAHELLQQL